MHESYDDIRSRIAEPPRWFDEHAVPRYGAFTPRATANIYADEAVLAEITCQGCGHAFRVAFTRLQYHIASRPSLASEILARTLHYGDPPNIGCCAAGPTMNSEPRRVVEYWRRDLPAGWQRDPALEVAIQPDWVREADRERAD